MTPEDMILMRESERIQNQVLRLMDYMEEERPESFNYENAWAVGIYRELAELSIRIAKLEET